LWIVILLQGLQDPSASQVLLLLGGCASPSRL
jgi:hypothetical protein